MRYGSRVNVLIAACAISAGIHGALVPEHFDEAAAAGAGFLVATALLAVPAVWLTRRPDSRAADACAATVLVGLIVSYALAVTTGVPVLHPEPEPIEGLAVATKVIEAAGLAAGSTLLRRPTAPAVIPQAKGA